MLSRSETPVSRISVDSQQGSIIKKHFDDRAQTWLSISKVLDKESSRSQLSNAILTSGEEVPYEVVWKQSKVSEALHSDEFKSNYGSATVLAATSTFIAVGTSSGIVVGFNYHQEISFVTDLATNSSTTNSNVPDVSPITCLAFSSSSSSVAAGYQNGSIRIWEIPIAASEIDPSHPIELIHIINPVSLEDRFTMNRSGHLSLPITSISFVSTSNTQLVASDVSGLVFYHHLFKRLMKRGVTSIKLFGRNDANIISESGKFVIYGCEQLPLGSEYSITDDLAVFAVITSSMLAIVSILSLNNSSDLKVKTHYTVGRATEVVRAVNGSNSNGNHENGTDSNSGITSPTPVRESSVRSSSLNWVPGRKVANGSWEGAKLIYTYNRTLTILQLDTTNLKEMASALANVKDKDKLIPSLQFERVCRWKYSDDISAVRWLSSDVFMLFAPSKFSVCHYDTVRGKVTEFCGSPPPFDVQPLELVHSSRDQEFTASTIDSSIVMVKRTIMAHSSSGIFFGSLPSWADTLVGLLSKHAYRSALSVALKYFSTSDPSEISVAGLPSDQKARKSLVRPYMVRILKEVGLIFERGHLNSLSETKDESEQDLALTILVLCIQTIAQLQYQSEGEDDYSSILDTFYTSFNDDALFFETIIPYCLNGMISYLPPLILKRLVEYAVSMNKGDTLTEVICSLNIQSLDIDLTLRLCNQHGLRDCTIYIWSYVLQNYVYPLIEFINEIINGETEHLDKAFAYMSFIFTGRQYPTDRPIDYAVVSGAQDNIARFLFSINQLPEMPVDDDTVFPYLHTFLTFDSFQMLSCINEFFESSYLNEDSTTHLTRQYIVDCLLDVYHSSSSTFSKLDWTNLAIFVARNYAKYSQFIRLSESVLEKVVDDLCSFSNDSSSYDCELALQSLLPHYEPPNEAILLSKLKSAKFHNVLIGLYRVKGEYAHALNAWCESWDHSQEDMGQGSLAANLETAYLNCTTTSARMDLKEVIRKHFSQFIEIDNVEFVRLNSKFEPSLHDECMKMGDGLAYSYLRELFANNWETQDIPDIGKMMTRYTTLLCDRDPDHVLVWVKQNGKLLLKKGEVSKVKGILKQRNQVMALVVLLQNKEDYNSAVDELLSAFETDIESLRHHKSTTESTEDRKEKLQLLAAICGEKEDLWLSVIERFISLSKDMADESDTASRVLRECILYCFKEVSDGSVTRSDDSLIMKVLHRMIGTESTVMSQFRSILGDVFISYSYEGTMSEIVLRIVNQDIKKSILTIRSNNLMGWSINSRNCTSCGKVLCGGVEQGNYDANRVREYEKLWGGQEVNSSFYGFTIVLFNCQHSYHLRCLEKLGWHRNEPCVICKP
ncbi:Vacuolar protein sorting-associated protein 8 [Meyerozyma guilliermondii]